MYLILEIRAPFRKRVPKTRVINAEILARRGTVDLSTPKIHLVHRTPIMPTEL